MTFVFNSFPSGTAPPQDQHAMQDVACEQAATKAATVSPMPIACRKRSRSDNDEGDDLLDEQIERQTGVRGLRKLANMPRSNGANEPAQFHALPAELNMQLLANMGYLSTMQQQPLSSMPRAIDSFSSRISHSPTSSFSDFGGPSTPSDVAGSTESYFTKGMRRDSSSSTSAYPDFNIYPGLNTPAQHTPGLLGMHMNAPPPACVGSSDPNGMQMDGMEEQAPIKTHGPDCKSIPQLHVRSEPGVYSELWASCRDCGQMQKVDSPPVSDTLSYSP